MFRFRSVDTVIPLGLGLLLAGAAGCTEASAPSPAPVMPSGPVTALTELSATVQDAAQAASKAVAAPKSGELESGAARVGLLWIDDLTPPDQPATLIVQELSITGEFPDAFTIELAEAPPAALLEKHAHPSGVMVLLREDAEFDEAISSGDANGNVLPWLSESEMDALGIVSIPPVYVRYVSDNDDTVYDLNIDRSWQQQPVPSDPDQMVDAGGPSTPGTPPGLGDPLPAGYHVAQFFGPGTNEMHRYYICQDYEGGEDCGEYYYHLHPEEATPTRILPGEELNVVIGGESDLILTPRPE
ncbi:hypothetical protein [Haliangium ochraceum]|uniref:Lipoprotein n=1 Tax=Haliangium ochraceum (strain DSM 14365 / JCM 11303 / SMP-2) TaxID=502025 RepID=D0LVT3_HALO1|nr:hypothetical protein [Haliangium ochraceum]ACY14067.1 hypothetical protein Hoch_1515 [Haliangium ochraceum DSM 14365]